ncbi:MAG: amidohydrolase family protein, partial [Kangiellaceae bacterium]|nr:amidohydrolase family protein [Kangiellaceae bacterium]
ALDMHTAVNNAVKMLAINKTAAINLASKNPASFLGLNKKYGSLKKGRNASMLLLDSEGKIVSSWIDGVQVLLGDI